MKDLGLGVILKEISEIIIIKRFMTHSFNLSMIYSYEKIIQDDNLEVLVLYIRITCPCDLCPLTPHFYIVKLGCTGVFILSYFCSKHRS